MAEMDMVERVARAIYAERQVVKKGKRRARSWGELSPSWQAFWRKQARAAIEAMREPTDAMGGAGLDVWNVEASPDSIAGNPSR